MRFLATLAALACAASLATAAPLVTIEPRQAGSTANYPPPFATPPLSMTPQAWLDALHQAETQGLIPNIPPSINPQGPLAYPAGVDPTSPTICSWTYNQCEGPHSIHTAPPGQIAMNFDDGPTDGTPQLLAFLEANKQKASHFLIGSNILANPDMFKQMAASPLHQMAVHTFSHPPLISSFSNEAIVAELGWTMQIIADMSGGRIPSFWRAPSGDIDNRVLAIAYYVFGLTHVSWNADSDDWRMPATATMEQVTQNIQQGVQQAVQSGQGVICLEHELRQQTVDAFIQVTWPLISQYKLDPRAVPDLGNGTAWYANAQDNTSPIQQRSGILPQNSTISSNSSSTARPANSTTAPATVKTNATNTQAGGAAPATKTVTVIPAEGQKSGASAQFSSSLLVAALFAGAGSLLVML